jgi:hypothetical protein
MLAHTRNREQQRHMTGDNLFGAYHEAMRDYEAAKAGLGNRVEAFITFLVAERVLAANLGKVGQNLECYQEHVLPW